MLLAGPGGETEASWVEPEGFLLLERPDAVLFVPNSGGGRHAWRTENRQVLLGQQVVGMDLTGMSSGELSRRLERLPASPRWLILDAAALGEGVLERLGRITHLQLALVCPVSRPCSLPSLEPLGAVLRGLSLKEAILSLGTMRELGSLRRLVHLSLRGARVPAAVWSALGRLTDLVALDLAGIVPGRWAPISQSLSRLEWLDLSFGTVPPEVLAALGDLSRLRTLRLAATPTRDDDLQVISELPLLRELDLSLTSIGDAGLKALGGQAQLRALDLGHTRVTELGLPHLAEFPGLRLLLAPPAMTDEGLGWLDRLVHLEGLSLRGSGVTPEGLAAIASLKRLWWLDLAGRPTWPPEGRRERLDPAPCAKEQHREGEERAGSFPSLAPPPHAPQTREELKPPPKVGARALPGGDNELTTCRSRWFRIATVSGRGRLEPTGAP